MSNHAATLRGGAVPPSRRPLSSLEQNIQKVRHMVDRLKKMKSKHISVAELNTEFGIMTQKLDIHTAKPEHGGTVFTILPDADVIDRLLSKYAPQKDPDAYPGTFELENGFDPLNSFLGGLSESIHTRDAIFSYLEQSQDEEELGTIIYNETNWRLGLIETVDLSRTGELHNNWEISCILHQCDPNEAKRPYCYPTEPSPKFPHIQACVHDDLAIRNAETLSVAELTTIFVLALRVVTKPMYHHANVIPVTVYSGSDRKIRILQGSVDFQNCNIEVGRTRVLDFETGLHGANERNFKLILAWLIGSPAGDVM